MKNYLGSFGKGTETSRSFNISEAGGDWCHVSCLYHPESENPLAETVSAKDKCYMVRLQKVYRSFETSLAARRKLNPADVLNAAIGELELRLTNGEKIDWLRISVGGSLPPVDEARKNDRFRKALRRLADVCNRWGVKVHLPIEETEKARFYRRVLQGLGITVRESLQDPEAYKTATGAVSWVAGLDIQSGRNIRARRVEAARQQAAERRESTGRKTIVCPAVVNPKNEKAKCGSCTACAYEHIDVVYPLH